MKNYKIINAAIFALAIVISGYILGNSYKNRNKSIRKIEVTGMAENNFSSDLIVWNGDFARTNIDMKIASNQLKKDAQIVKDFLLSQNISENEILFSSISIDKLYSTTYDIDGNSKSTFSGYRLTQNVNIESNNIPQVEKVSRDISSLIDKGVEFSSYSPLYYYTKLADLKQKLIEAATIDARERASKIAENSGGKLGKLQSGTMGVFQITGRNSDEDFSWGGSFNTSSREKTASVTAKLVFEVR